MSYSKGFNEKMAFKGNNRGSVMQLFQETAPSIRGSKGDRVELFEEPGDLQMLEDGSTGDVLALTRGCSTQRLL